MGKNDFMDGRNEGMVYALRIAKEGGISALEEEIRFRGIERLSAPIRKADFENLKTSLVQRINHFYLCMSVLTLHDEFDFEQEECIRFVNRMNKKSECIADPDAGGEMPTLEDYAEIVKEELGIAIDVDGIMSRKRG